MFVKFEAECGTVLVDSNVWDSFSKEYQADFLIRFKVKSYQRMKGFSVGLHSDFAIIDEFCEIKRRLELVKPIMIEPFQPTTKGIYQKRYKAEVNQNNDWRKGKSRFSGYCSSTGV